MNYIFLDCDGVINRKSDWNKSFYFSPELVKRIAKLSLQTRSEIILASTWRNGGIPDDLQAEFNKDGANICDVTPLLKGRNRTKEIERYLYFNQCDKYVILDDDKSLYDSSTKNLYLINADTGITDLDIRTIQKRYF